MTCADCKFWNAGECRRFPPTLHKTGEPAEADPGQGVILKSFWPVTRAEDWCGEVTE